MQSMARTPQHIPPINMLPMSLLPQNDRSPPSNNKTTRAEILPLASWNMDNDDSSDVMRITVISKDTLAQLK